MRDQMRQGRLMCADDDFLAAPSPGEVWRQLAADALMQIE
jgi:hypothetical protein